MLRKRLNPAVAVLLALALSACGGSDKKKPAGGKDDPPGGTSETYSISGNFGIDAKYADFSAFKASSLENLHPEHVNGRPETRTACSDGLFYAVYCLSYSTPPVAAEGDIDCAGDGAFTVAGLPKGKPIGCFVVRYETVDSEDAETVGAIQIPATTINGSSDTLVASGNVVLNVNIDESGTISASVVSGDLDNDFTSQVSDAFNPTSFNGIWKIECSSNAGGDQFSAGKCKCFLGEEQFGEAYENQSECMSDPNGPGAAITQPVKMVVGLSTFNATTASEIPMDQGSIPAGTSLKAISIWGATGSGPYTSMRGAGGEGVSTLGGALNWATTPLNPTTDVAWTSGSQTLDIGGDDITFTIPAFAKMSKTRKVAPPSNHDDWMTWIQALTDAAKAGGYECNSGPSNSEAVANNGTYSLNIECMNKVLDAMMDSRDLILPRVRIHPFCDHTGCKISSDIEDAAEPFYHEDALEIAHIEIEGAELEYGEPWTDTAPVTPAEQREDSIGVRPSARFVFEALMPFPGGAGFRQGDHNERHYHCGTSDAQVINAACSDSQTHYELVCHGREELSIKFLGNPPFDMIFDQSQSIGYAELRAHSMQGHQVVQPTGTTAMALCKQMSGVGGGKFFAKATKLQ